MSRLTTLLALFAIVFSAANVQANDNENGNGNGQLSSTKQATFKANNPVVLLVGEASGNNSTKLVPVVTNTRNKVTVTWTNFTRNERSCNGTVLQTVDTIQACGTVGFQEMIFNQNGGAALEVKPLTSSTWCVNPHRGGYWLKLNLVPVNAQIWADAGCYTATATMTVTAEPFEDCCDID